MSFEDVAMTGHFQMGSRRSSVRGTITQRQCSSTKEGTKLKRWFTGRLAYSQYSESVLQATERQSTVICSPFPYIPSIPSIQATEEAEHSNMLAYSPSFHPSVPFLLADGTRQADETSLRWNQATVPSNNKPKHYKSGKYEPDKK